MKQLTTTLNGREILLVEVPEGSEIEKFITKGDDIRPSFISYEEVDDDGNIIGGSWNYVDLPSGNWKLLGLSSEITEEIAARIMPKAVDAYLLYGTSHWDDCTDYAVVALRSFLQANGFSPSTTVILIKE